MWYVSTRALIFSEKGKFRVPIIEAEIDNYKFTISWLFGCISTSPHVKCDCQAAQNVTPSELLRLAKLAVIK